MVNVHPQSGRSEYDDARAGSGSPLHPGRGGCWRRFNVLLTEDRAHSGEHWTNQLPRLLEPMGVQTYLARTGRQAIELAERQVIHAAVIDLSTPQDEARSQAAGRSIDSGLWLLELLRRLPNRPPVVVLRQPAISFREAERMLREALRLGAFSVLDKPVGIEDVLSVFRRLVDRQYRGQWPGDDEESATQRNQ